MNEMLSHIQTAMIRINSMRHTMRNVESVKELATRWGVDEQIIYAMLVLQIDGFNDVDDEIRYALQCKVDADVLSDALVHCIADKTLQPLKMLYAEVGGGTE